MLEINIQAVPNQQFTVEIAGSRVDIALRTANDVMVADIALNDIMLIRGTRLVAGGFILPYKYISTWGNLMLVTQADELPWWDKFGVNQSLIYLAPEEVEAVQS